MLTIPRTIALSQLVELRELNPARSALTLEVPEVFLSTECLPGLNLPRALMASEGLKTPRCI